MQHGATAPTSLSTPARSTGDRQRQTWRKRIFQTISTSQTSIWLCQASASSTLADGWRWPSDRLSGLRFEDLPLLAAQLVWVIILASLRRSGRACELDRRKQNAR